MRLKNPHWAQMTSLVIGVILMLASSGEGTAESPSVSISDPHGIVEWGRNIYADGTHHNAWPDIAYWQGNYYVVFTRSTFHDTEGVGMVLRSSIRYCLSRCMRKSSSCGGRFQFSLLRQ